MKNRRRRREKGGDVVNTESGMAPHRQTWIGRWVKSVVEKFGLETRDSPSYCEGFVPRPIKDFYF